MPEGILSERQKTHGNFYTNARISQILKEYFRMWGMPASTVQREALDQIALKLSRILSGQANFKDHWDDIAGYAQLGSRDCDASNLNREPSTSCGASGTLTPNPGSGGGMSYA